MAKFPKIAAYAEQFDIDLFVDEDGICAQASVEIDDAGRLFQ